MLPTENPGLCTVLEGGNDDGPAYLDLCGETERVTVILSLTVFHGTAGFGLAVVKILADCGIIGDGATQVSEVFFRI